MAASIGILPGSIETEDTKRLYDNQERMTPNITSTPTPALPRGHSDLRSTGSSCSKRRCKIRLNIGGILFKTNSQTLHQFPLTRLARLSKDDDSYDPEEKEYFFDRNPLVFHGVLDYYRTGELHMPQNICARVVHNELTFWGFQDKELSECCWQKYQEYRNTEECLHHVMNTFSHETGIPPPDKPTRWQHCRHIMWNVLEYPKSSRIALMWAIGFSIVMLVSIFVTVFEGLPEFRVHAESTAMTQFLNKTTNPKEQLTLSTELHPVMVQLEVISSILLTIDLVFRLIFCPSKLDFFKSSLNWIEILSQIMVWYVAFHYMLPILETDIQLKIFIAAVCLRNLRVLRLFRMAKHLPAWRILVLSLKHSTSEIVALSAFVFTGVLVFAVLIYSAQFFSDDEFTNVPIGFWWAVVTMTTVGYGDFYPTTIPGYVVGAVCAVSGMLATGLPIPLIANNFNLLYSYYKMNIDRSNENSKQNKTSSTPPPGDWQTKCLDASIKALQSSNDSAYVEDCMAEEVIGEHLYKKAPDEDVHI